MYGVLHFVFRFESVHVIGNKTIIKFCSQSQNLKDYVDLVNVCGFD